MFKTEIIRVDCVAGIDVCFNTDLPRLALRLDGIDYFSDYLGSPDQLPVEFDAPCLDLAQIENLINDVKQMSGIALNMTDK